MTQTLDRIGRPDSQVNADAKLCRLAGADGTVGYLNGLLADLLKTMEPDELEIRRCEDRIEQCEQRLGPLRTTAAQLRTALRSWPRVEIELPFTAC